MRDYNEIDHTPDVTDGAGRYWDKVAAEGNEAEAAAAERTLEAMQQTDAAYRCDVGELGIESEFLDVLSMWAVERYLHPETATPAAEIAEKLRAFGEELVRNRDADFWASADESKRANARAFPELPAFPSIHGGKQ